ncbi:MAG: energy-coupling factor transporter transmembrane component T, partial [Candidatus Kariarchaeaceae archaeon]
MLEIFQFDETIESNFINDRNPTIKFFIALLFLIVIFIESSLLPLFIIFILILTFSVRSQGLNRILGIYWALKYYIVVVLLVTFTFNDFRFSNLVILTLLKLVSIFIAFSFFSKTTTPENLIDVLMQLKIPPNIAWSIGVAFRQAIVILEEVYYIQTIQRLRNNYETMQVFQKIVFRIKEIY